MIPGGGRTLKVVALGLGTEGSGFADDPVSFGTATKFRQANGSGTKRAVNVVQLRTFPEI